MCLTTLLLGLFMLVPLQVNPQRKDDKASPKTEIRSVGAGNQLLGKHKFQLHWLSWNRWKDFADLTVVNRNGTFVIKARQQKGGDYVEILGHVLSVEEKEFTFQGTSYQS